MSDAIAALSDAMRNDAETLRVIGQNVANIETVAYRREIAVMRPNFDQVTDDARAERAWAGRAGNRDRPAARHAQEHQRIAASGARRPGLLRRRHAARRGADAPR